MGAPVGDVVSSLAAAGLRIDFLHEHPGDIYSPTSLSGNAEGSDRAQLPALYSIRAHLSG